MRLDRTKTVLLLVDVQGKLAQVMHDREALFANLQRLVTGLQMLGVPILWVEQNPQGLGPTIPEVGRLLNAQEPISKSSFSACGEPRVKERLAALGPSHVLLAGIEAHVCIYQSTLDLIELGYAVQVVGDAVSSRTAANRELALQRVRAAGAEVTGTEMVLFELLGDADAPEFKELLRLVK
jgi:nicotinamidase-related amidase